MIKPNSTEPVMMAPKSQLNYIKEFDNSNNLDISSKAETEIWRLCFNDSIIVKYYQRASWKYYIGFIKDISVENRESYFTINF